MANSGLNPYLTAYSILLVIVNASGGKTPDPAGCPPDTYLGKRPDDTWDCLFCTPTCPPGTEEEAPCTKERDLQCRDCPDGTFNDGSTTTCRNCTVCLNGQVVINCTLNNDTVCEKYKKTADGKDDSLLVKIMVAGVAGACVTGVILVALVWFCNQRRRKNLNAQTVEKKSESQSQSFDEDGVNTSLLNREQSWKTETSTITETGNTSKESKEEIMNNVDCSRKDNVPEINHTSEQVPPEQDSKQSASFLKTAAGYALNNFPSNDTTTACQFARF